MKKSNDEVVKIDEAEYEKQRLEEMLKGKYLEVRIVVPRIDFDEIGNEGGVMPYTHVLHRGGNPISTMIMIQTLRELANELERKEPDVRLLKEILGIKTTKLSDITREIEEDE